MKIVLIIPTSGVENGKPKEWFAQRLDTAIEYYRNLKQVANVTFVAAGRWNNVDDEFLQSEAEVAKRYILEKIPAALVLKEDVSVETAGNFAFSKPLVASAKPDKVVVFCSKVHLMRIEYLVKKVYDPSWEIEYVTVADTLSENPRAQLKEPKALFMFKKLLDGIKDGDDVAARDILLYKTPFYFRGFINDKDFFDSVWPGGFEDFKEKRLSINNK